ncbi:MAG: hypothetical protein ABL949_04060 [Fimbriimonadaceae bacterium]
MRGPLFGLGAFLLVGLAWFIFRPLSWRDAAVAASDVIAGKDPEPMVKFINEDELKAFSLSKEQAKAILKEVVQPIMRKFKTSEWLGVPTQHGHNYGIALEILDGKRKLPWGIQVTETKNGPRVLLGVAAVCCLRAIQWKGTNEKDPNWKGRFAKVSAKLREMGLSGTWDSASGKIEPWPSNPK